jgi:hypothetical protein
MSSSIITAAVRAGLQAVRSGQNTHRDKKKQLLQKIIYRKCILKGR